MAAVATTSLPGQLWRVHKVAYGPLNPPPRSGGPDLRWSRFDLSGWAVVYGARTRQGAFLESLSYAEAESLDLGTLFDDDADPVATQWKALGHMAPGQVARQWRDVRQLSRFSRPVPAPGRVIDLLSSTTIGYLRATAGEWAPVEMREDPRLIDVSSLTGSDRRFTSLVSWWLSRTVLDSGELPIGMKYSSRHGGEIECYALWIDMDRFGPATSISSAVATEYTVDRSHAIGADDEDLVRAADLLGLKVF